MLVFSSIIYDDKAANPIIKEISMKKELLDINMIDATATLNWDEYFMLQAMMASLRSKDPNTKVGCVFVDDDNHQVSMGYNGFVAGVNEADLPWGKDSAVPFEYQKYAYVVHSEANAILHAKTSLKGTRLYVTLFPCHECAKMIATSGIKEVIYLNNKYEGTEGNRISKRIFEMSGINHRQFIPKEEIIEKVQSHMGNLLEPKK